MILDSKINSLVNHLMPITITGVYRNKQFLVRFTLSILFFGEVVLSIGENGSDWTCKEYIADDGLLVADCSNQKKIMNIPNNLNPNIEVLNLSGNTLIKCTNKSFERYQETLITLDISNSYSSQTHYDKGCYLVLSKLQTLNLSKTCLPSPKNDYTRLSLPITIREFVYEYCPNSYDNFSEMLNLEEFKASGTNYSNIPWFDERTPLRYVDLRGTDLSSFEVRDIAVHCEISELLLQVEDEKGIQDPNEYCRCVKAEKWLNSISVQYTKLNCTKPFAPPSSCIPDEQAVYMYEQCLQRVGRAKGISTNLIWAMIGVALLVILGSFGVLCYNNVRRRINRARARRSKKSESDEIRETHEDRQAEASETNEEVITE